MKSSEEVIWSFEGATNTRRKLGAALCVSLSAGAARGGLLLMTDGSQMNYLIQHLHSKNGRQVEVFEAV